MKAKLRDREGVNLNEDFQEESSVEVELSSLLPENFNEIPYLTQINIKKKAMETFNEELFKVI